MQIHSQTRRMFKDNDCPQSVPDGLLNEEWAQKIHGQTLARLNERGGMGINEIMANIKKLPYHEIKGETIEMLDELKKLMAG